MRQRIVINLDAPSGSAPQSRQAANVRRRRWPRILAILVGAVIFVFVAAVVGGFLFWRYYQSTPTYTVTMMVYAAQRDDLVEFHKRIDDEEIAKNMVASISQRAARRYGLALSGSVQQRIDQAVPSLMPRIKQAIQEEVTREIKDVSSAAKPRSFFFLLFTVPSLVRVTTAGDTAKAFAAITERTIELTMKRNPEGWKVTEFKDDLVEERIVDSVMKEMPPLGSIESNSPLLKQFGRGKRGRRRR